MTRQPEPESAPPAGPCPHCGGPTTPCEVAFTGGARIGDVLLDVVGTTLAALCGTCCPACGNTLTIANQKARCMACD